MTFWNKFYFVFSRISIHALKHDDDDGGGGDAGVTNSYYFQPQVMKANTESSNPQTLESGHGFPPEKGIFIGLWLEKCGDHWKQFYQFLIIVNHKFLNSEASSLC